MYAALLFVYFGLMLTSTALILSVDSLDASLPGANLSMDGLLLNESLTMNEATCSPSCTRTKLSGSARKVRLSSTTGISSRFPRRLQPRSIFMEDLLLKINNISLSSEIRCLAIYLAAHKYFGFDTRKGTELMWKYKAKGFYDHFPKPRLSELHPVVSRVCTEDLIRCLRELAHTCRSSYAMKDTGLGGDFPCKDPARPCLYGKTYPFKTVEEVFSWRTSASYFLCWHALQQRYLFKTFMDGKNCLEGLEKVQEFFGQDRRVVDFRADLIYRPYECALIAFCPDPCYGRQTKGSVISAEFKRKDPGNQCRGLKDTTCEWDFERNSNFEDLQRNRFNVTCRCAWERMGFEWNSQYELCVVVSRVPQARLLIQATECARCGINPKTKYAYISCKWRFNGEKTLKCLQQNTDECSTLKNPCEENKICQNQIGSYTCLCKRGYRLHADTGKCYEHYHLPRPQTRLQKLAKKVVVKGPESFYEDQLSFLLGLSGSSLQRVAKTTIHLCLLIVAVVGK